MAGMVYLVGAGPGDPELLTLKALRLMRSADVIVHDRLVSESVLALAPEQATLIDVGKSANCHPIPQHEINAILVTLATAGRNVVRLKGGDPFLFGRGGEEMQALATSGIECEIVPGITSAQGTSAELKVPLTQRGLATGVRLVTGHFRENARLDVDWHGLADSGTTLVIYMGLATIGEFARGLIAHGRAPETPVLAASRATQPARRHLLSTLGCVEQAVIENRFTSPVVFIVGEVAGLMQPVKHKMEQRRAEATSSTAA